MLYYGMKPWRADAVKLEFGAYINRVTLPALPKTFGHVGRAQPPIDGGWQMLGNDQAGDCVLAGAAHETMVYAWATKRPIPRFTTANILKQYYELTGGADEGLDPITTAKWRCSTGLTDADGVTHAIKAFAAVGTIEDIELSVYLFGLCGLGFELPNNAEDFFRNREPWADQSKAPDPKAGHYVPIVGKNSKGELIGVTWGRLQAISEAFIRTYCVGGLCFFSREYLMSIGASPELFNESQLDADLSALGTTQTA